MPSGWKSWIAPWPTVRFAHQRYQWTFRTTFSSSLMEGRWWQEPICLHRSQPPSLPFPTWGDWRPEGGEGLAEDHGEVGPGVQMPSTEPWTEPLHHQAARLCLPTLSPWVPEIVLLGDNEAGILSKDAVCVFSLGKRVWLLHNTCLVKIFLKYFYLWLWLIL